MKDNKNDSTTVLSRFGRDKRQRTVTARRSVSSVARVYSVMLPIRSNRPARGPVGGPPTIPISRRTIALHSTNRAASSATNRLTASVSPAINPVTSTATATNRAASTVTSPPMASANSATNPATSTATATSRAANMATSPPTVNVSSGIRNTATVNSATNPISRGRGSTTTNRRPTRNSRPKSRSAKCA